MERSSYATASLDTCVASPFVALKLPSASPLYKTLQGPGQQEVHSCYYSHQWWLEGGKRDTLVSVETTPTYE